MTYMPNQTDFTVAHTVTRASEHLEELFTDAFRRLGDGETITFEVMTQALPDPTQTNAWNPMVIIYAAIPALTPRMDHMATSGTPLPLNGWTQAEADEVAGKLLEILRGARFDEHARLVGGVTSEEPAGD